MESLGLGVKGVWLLMGFGLVSAACSSDEGGGAGVPAASLTFCDVAPILERKCARCHSEPPQHGAPFPLVSYADAVASAPGSGSRWHELMLTAVRTNAMPDLSISLDPPVSALSCEEKATLMGWLENGGAAPPSSDAKCTASAPRTLSCD